MRSLLTVLVSLSLAFAVAASEESRKVDEWKGFAGVRFREDFAKRKDFKKSWKKATVDRSGVFYKHLGAHPFFMKVPVRDLMVVTSKRYGVVVAFTLSMSGAKTCADARRAMEKAWGPPFVVQRDRIYEWKGKRLDVDLELGASDQCMIFASDVTWDDVRDVFKKK